jgi:hypothetical protein
MPEIETYVMEYIEGPLLSDELRHARYFSSYRKFKALQNYYYLCGRWLKHFQEFTGTHTAGAEAMEDLMQRCEQRLILIENSNDSRIPKGFRKRVSDFMNDQLKVLENSEILVSGRHGDFGGWNILVGQNGITVIDFLGYQTESIAVDIVKMLVNFYDEKKYLAYSKRRINELKEAFLAGYGELPPVQRPVLCICETLYRVSSLLSTVSITQKRLYRGIEKNLSSKAHLYWLMADQKKHLIWPSSIGGN